LVLGSATNHSGRAKTISTPSVDQQAAVVDEALRDADVDPAEVSLVEAHGVGSALGDAVEVEALCAVLDRGRAVDQRWFLGSVKANIGHLEWASGIASLAKVLLCLEHGEVPPQIHLRAPSAPIAR